MEEGKGERERKKKKFIKLSENREGIPKSDDTMNLKDSLPKRNLIIEELSPEYLNL